MILLAIALQAAAVPLPPAPEPALLPVETRADGSQRWSIMSCPTRQKAGEIVDPGTQGCGMSSGQAGA